jgi:hypothetical protein
MAYGTVNAEQMTTQSGFTLGAGNSSSFKNRIINGAMVIDQRNAGATVSVSTDVFTLDRWRGDNNGGGGVYSVQQSTTVPANFVNSSLITVTTADASIGATEAYSFTQRIEGFNIADFGWGTASAQTVTLSFMVRSSVTGTFGGAFQNSDNTRSYPFSYTISSANTWESKSVTITGDTSGTWQTGTGIGIRCVFSLGVGSSRKSTAGVWASADYRASTGSVDIISTSGATFFITGVQVEVGTVATSFDYRSYGTELALCYRYYEQILYGTGNNSGNGMISIGQAITTSSAQVPYTWTTTKRASPTISTSSASTTLYGATGTAYAATLSFANINTQSCYMNASQNSGSNLIAGNATLIYASTGLYVQISSEL